VSVDFKNLQQDKADIEKLECIIKRLKEKYKEAATPEEKTHAMDGIRAYTKQYRIKRSEYDVLFFTYEYFSDERNPENENNLIPIGTHLSDAPEFHGELCSILNILSTEEPTKRIAWSVPRGHAKSAYLSNVFPVHQIIFKLRKYILIVSETESMSRKFVEWVSDQLKFNIKLRKDFGDFLSSNKRENLKDNQEGFVTLTNTRVQGASIGKQLRGARHGAFRPDLIILDDLESSKNTNTKELRDKNLHWFNSVIIPIGDPSRTAIIYMGTLVHGQGLLPGVLSRADFEGRIHSAIVQEPDNEELWQRFEEIYREQENSGRMEEAIAFYDEHKEQMDKGVRTLWESRFPYYKLIMEKVNIGTRAFGSEFLNKPIDDENAIFKPSFFSFFDDKDLYDQFNRLLPLDIYTFWDIAIGKNNRSDYNAIVTIGRDKRTGIIYVLDAWAKKCPMHEALEVAVEKVTQYKPRTVGVETVQAQYDMFRQLRDKLTKRGIYHSRVKAVNPKGKKEVRIEQLEPLFENGVLRLKYSQRLMREMLEQFPAHDHDDLPDALASVVELAGANNRRVFYKKPHGM
jgi:predicted phage terminase large subunit-like protein